MTTPDPPTATCPECQRPGVRLREARESRSLIGELLPSRGLVYAMHTDPRKAGIKGGSPTCGGTGMMVRGFVTPTPEPPTKHGVICPRCEGRKGHTVYACPGFRPVFLACEACVGSGEVAAERGAELSRWRAEGQAIRSARVAAHIPLREAAVERSVDVVTYSRIEFGMEPAPWLAEGAAGHCSKCGELFALKDGTIPDHGCELPQPDACVKCGSLDVKIFAPFMCGPCYIAESNEDE